MADTFKLSNFFAAKGIDDQGRSFVDYLGFSDEQLEALHNYVQWAFPTLTPSHCNANAPILDDEALQHMKRTKDAVYNFRLFLERMIKFYENNDHWLVEQDHNHLRITRIIESVSKIIGTGEASQFYVFVTRRNFEAGEPINEKSINFWRDALVKNSSVPAIVDYHLRRQ